MENSTNNPSNGYSLAHFPDSCHICLIYDSEEQRKKIVSEYLASGLRKGELVSYFTDKTSPETVLKWLTDQGVELPKSEDFPRFRVTKADESLYFCTRASGPKSVLHQTKRLTAFAQVKIICFYD